MADKAKAIPAGYNSLTPYITVKDAEKAINFYKKAFRAVEKSMHRLDDGSIMHAELQIGNSLIMIGQHNEASTPPSSKFPFLSLYFYTDDVDTTFNRAVDLGGKVVMPVEDQFYGDRSGGVEDPFGICWWISTNIEEVSEEELKRRMSVRK